MARVTRAQVGAVDVGVDVDDGLDVVVADGAQLGAGHDGGEVAEHLHWRAAPGRGGGERRRAGAAPGAAPGAAEVVAGCVRGRSRDRQALQLRPAMSSRYCGA